jgi:DNA-binding transcriptional LysR family regulator
MYDWNDLRIFLAVARSGSSLSASRALGISQATVSRRVAALEQELGVELFSRTAAGYALTARGLALVPRAEAVEAAAGDFAEAAGAEARRLSGTVRLTTVEAAANAWVIPAIAGLHESQPGVQVDIITTDANLDLARGEADVAIRFGPRPAEDTLVVRRLAELEQTIYASHDLVARLGRPRDLADLARYPLIIENYANFGRFADWLIAAVPDGRIVQRVSSLSGLVASVRSGIGAAVLPCVIADSIRSLARLMPPIPDLAAPCWMVTTDHARRQPHIREVIDRVVSQVERATARPPQQALSA